MTLLASPPIDLERDWSLSRRFYRCSKWAGRHLIPRRLLTKEATRCTMFLGSYNLDYLRSYMKTLRRLQKNSSVDVVWDNERLMDKSLTLF